MKRYLKVDYHYGFTSICETKEEVITSCGYDFIYEESTFEEFLIKVKGEFDIIEIEGEILFLNS
jgi:hypothetical protein